jgi:hypothetical protein
MIDKHKTYPDNVDKIKNGRCAGRIANIWLHENDRSTKVSPLRMMNEMLSDHLHYLRVKREGEVGAILEQLVLHSTLVTKIIQVVGSRDCKIQMEG